MVQDRGYSVAKQNIGATAAWTRFGGLEWSSWWEGARSRVIASAAVRTLLANASTASRGGCRFGPVPVCSAELLALKKAWVVHDATRELILCSRPTGTRRLLETQRVADGTTVRVAGFDLMNMGEARDWTETSSVREVMLPKSRPGHLTDVTRSGAETGETPSACPWRGKGETLNSSQRQHVGEQREHQEVVQSLAAMSRAQHQTNTKMGRDTKCGHVASLEQLVKLDCEQKDLARHASQGEWPGGAQRTERQRPGQSKRDDG